MGSALLIVSGCVLLLTGRRVSDMIAAAQDKAGTPVDSGWSRFSTLALAWILIGLGVWNALGEGERQLVAAGVHRARDMQSPMLVMLLPATVLLTMRRSPGYSAAAAWLRPAAWGSFFGGLLLAFWVWQGRLETAKAIALVQGFTLVVCSIPLSVAWSDHRARRVLIAAGLLSLGVGSLAWALMSG